MFGDGDSKGETSMKKIDNKKKKKKWIQKQKENSKKNEMKIEKEIKTLRDDEKNGMN